MPFTSFEFDSHPKIQIKDDWRVSYVSGPAPENIREKLSDLPATVPGCIHLDLLHEGLIPDPFFGQNEKIVAWVADCDWKYSTSIVLDESFNETGSEIIRQLVFEGLDTFAEIYIDGGKLGETDNMFISHRLELPDSIKAGEHKLEVLFRSPVKEVDRLVEEGGRVPDSFGGDRGWARKAQYSYGWDWGPILPTSGIWRDVYIQSWNKGRISWFSYGFERDGNKGILSVRIALKSLVTEPLELNLALEHDGEQINHHVHIDNINGNGETIIDTEVVIDKPKLWWPAGHGDQVLYDLSISLISNKKELHRFREKIGLRTVEWIQEKDEWGKSYFLRLNGRDIFCKGANWIPSDSFIPRITPGVYTRHLELARDSHMNMLRIWGGGLYEDRHFYSEADRFGIMIWQDFPYACAFYPDDKDFRENVRIETLSAVAQIARHPSIVYWCGNNEIERDAEVFQERFGVSYLGKTIWTKLIPEAVHEIDPHACYIYSSPAGGDIPNSPEEGDRHVWNVWSGWRPENLYLEEEGRFISEFGFQAPANLPTLSEALPLESRFPQSADLEWHNKQIDGPERIWRFLVENHRVTDDFARFIQLSQDVQGRALRLAVEHWQSRRPRTMGTLIWQLNDCWPVVSWSLLDWKLRPKASYYQVKRGYRSRNITLLENSEKVDLYLINDEQKKWSGSVLLRTFDFEGNIVKSGNLTFEINPESSCKVFEAAFEEWIKDRYDNFLVAEIQDENDEFTLPVRSFWFAEKFKHLNLRKPNVAIVPGRKDDRDVYKITTDLPAFGVWLSDTSNPNFAFIDNSLDLLPGDSFYMESLLTDGNESLPCQSPRIWTI